MEPSLPTPEKHEPAESIGAAMVNALKQLLIILRRRKTLLVTSLIVVYGCGALYYFSREFLYEAQASVLVHQSGDVLSGKVDETAGARQNYLPTQIRLINSWAVLSKAAEKLKATDVGTMVSLTAGNLAERLDVALLKDTEILNISYRATNPRVAVAVVEVVVASYLELVNEMHRSTSKEMLQILTQQKDDLDHQLRDKEGQLLALQQSAGVLTLGSEKMEGNTEGVARVTALSQALTQTHLRKLQLEADYRDVKEAVARGDPIEPFLLRHPEGLGQALPNAIPALKQPQNDSTRKELLLDQLELQRMQGIYGLKHPKVKALEDRIRMANQLLDEDKEHSAQTSRDLPTLLLEVLQHDLAEAQTLEQEIQNQFDVEKKKALEWNIRYAPLIALQAEVVRLNNLFGALTDRIRQVDLGEDYGAITTQLIEAPREPQEPVSPSLKKVALSSTALGILFGLGLCYLFEWWDTSYRGPEEIEQHLGAPVLGHVPWMASASEGKPVERIMEHTPHSAEAEAFRTLRAALMLCESAPKMFTITSPEAGDGKTSVVSNLAIAFAQSGLRTLIVDADMRRPRLRQIFQAHRSPGLSQLLQENEVAEEHLRQAIRPTSISKLDILPSGPNPPNAAELLTGPNVAKIIAWAEGNYDRIMFDAPPILAVSDCAILGRLLDGTLLVVRADKSDRVVAARARNALRGMSCPVLGVVVNGVLPGNAYGSAYYRSSDYYSSYSQKPADEQEDRDAEGDQADEGTGTERKMAA